MLLRILNDIETCLSVKAYFAALSLALMIPDICGRAEYGNIPVGCRYKSWYEEYVGKYEPYSMEGYNTGTPNLTGEVLYKLRCNMLHQGNPDVHKDGVKNKTDQVDKFVIEYEDGLETGHAGTASVRISPFGTEYRELTINLNTLCRKLCAVAKAYYEENPDKFDFFTYQFVKLEPAMQDESC